MSNFSLAVAAIVSILLILLMICYAIGGEPTNMLLCFIGLKLNEIQYELNKKTPSKGD